MSDDSGQTLYEKLIAENIDKGWQLKLVVSEFRGVQYLHLRKYFLSFEGEWIPSKEGATFEASIESIFSLLEGLLEICAYEENKVLVTDFISGKLNEQASRIPEQVR